jgi:hypothetical protein
MIEGAPHPAPNEPARFASFADFYPFYLAEHENRTSRRLHVVGTTLALVVLLYAVFTQRWAVILLAVVVGYAFAWIGHFFFEKNRPATFKHPLYSFMGDWRLWFETLTGRIAF